jgi:aldehyde dehydrogenase (NAD+)
MRGDATKALLVAGGPDVLAAAQGNFVPAVVLTSVKDSAEALALDARSGYALGASIFTRSAAAGMALAGKLRPGMIAVNECVVPAGEAALPFGGSGESGYGVRSGVEGLLEMTRPQTLGISTAGFRPHHFAGDETTGLLLALLRARHARGFVARLKGWLDYGLESVKWLRNRRRARTAKT